MLGFVQFEVNCVSNLNTLTKTYADGLGLEHVRRAFCSLTSLHCGFNMVDTMCPSAPLVVFFFVFMN